MYAGYIRYISTCCSQLCENLVTHDSGQSFLGSLQLFTGVIGLLFISRHFLSLNHAIATQSSINKRRQNIFQLMQWSTFTRLILWHYFADYPHSVFLTTLLQAPFQQCGCRLPSFFRNMARGFTATGIPTSDSVEWRAFVGFSIVSDESSPAMTTSRVRRNCLIRHPVLTSHPLCVAGLFPYEVRMPIPYRENCTQRIRSCFLRSRDLGCGLSPHTPNPHGE